jgi:putative lipoprotein
VTKRSGVTPRHLTLCLAAAACAGNAPPPAKTGVVAGTVAYRERMALPPDAVVQVQLSDVSLQDVPAQVVAETTLSPAGRQVPLPFELRYDPAKIEPRRRYAVRATIRSEGRLLFTTDTQVPVFTEGHPGKVDLMLVRVRSSEGAAPDQLWGTSWLLEDIGGTGVIDGAQATLEFPEVGKVAGRGSCNRFFGSVEVTGQSIVFGQLGSTRMACPEAVMNQEAKYLKALQDAERYGFDGAFLLIHTRGMEQPLRFTRHTP